MPTHSDLANAIRALSIDAVEQAKSGHPGMPMGMATIAEALWNEFYQHHPKNPNWWNRDRFILSNGHGSMLHYSLLHLAGYDLPIEEIKNFRQLHSKTPGHPEYGITKGIETTTGPLGQGLANAVGMAIAEKNLAENFNKENFPVVDHYTYVFAGDGCLMEGISHEACSLAGTLNLGKLIVFWDDNNISIDGDVSGWFTDNTEERFRAYQWQVIEGVDGHDRDAVIAAVKQAQLNTKQPTLICCKTTIGYGSLKLQGTSKVHGAPLGPEEAKATKAQLGWSHEPFEIPAEIYQAFDATEKGELLVNKWQTLFADYEKSHPELASEFKRRMNNELPTDFDKVYEDVVHKLQAEKNKVATRKASQNALEAYGPSLPELMGGSADLTGSNLTLWSGSKPLCPESCEGNYIYYGVREFGMSAIMNGLALHGGFRPYGGTFLTFLDYAKNAVRMSALMELPVIYVYTHDSIGLGEDGPTHQPIEHLNSVRIMPNTSLWRPCDEVETAVAWGVAIKQQKKPTVFALSRQGLPGQERSKEQVQNIEKGGYVLWQAKENHEATIIATGSEVAIALDAATSLASENISVRVVSMPSTDVFESQTDSYKESVLPKDNKPRVVIEAGNTDYWHKYLNGNGQIIGIDRFGESAPINDVYNALGITSQAVIQAVKASL